MELPPLNNKQLEEISKLKNMDNNLIDCSDINELSDEELVTGHFVYKD